MAVGTIVGTLTRIQTQQGRPQVAKLVLTCTASSTDGSYPATILNTLAVDSNGTSYDIRGLQFYSIKAIPGSIGPTADSDMTIADEYSLDLLGGKGTDLLKNSAKSWALFGPSGSVASALITGDVTLTITNNAVHSAAITIVLELIGV